MKRNDLPTPCYVIDIAALKKNLSILKELSKKSGAKILLAQKAFSMFALYPLIGKYLAGTTASSLFEAKLGKEEMGGETHIFSPGYRADEIKEITELCDHIIFNSFDQLNKYAPIVRDKGKQVGLRINPELSTQKEHAIYNPCSPGSRLGVTLANFYKANLPDISGLHFHTLCEQNSDDLEATLAEVEKKFGAYLYQMKWLNFGGGHWITADNYDITKLEQLIKYYQEKYHLTIYLEPGEAVALNAGHLISSVLDIVHNNIDIAMLDTSAACHMPDILEMPYRPHIINSGQKDVKSYSYQLAGPTCLAGDIIGEYSFDTPLKPGDKLTFCDMAIYTMVKNNTFNGINLPTIAVEDEDGVCQIIREFSYSDFKNRLS